MYVKYNAVLRGVDGDVDSLAAAFMTLCRGNRYCTTLHIINSCIVKTSKLTVASTVYRGISGGLLPDAFRNPNQFRVRGGIECVD